MIKAAPMRALLLLGPLLVFLGLFSSGRWSP